MKAFSTSYFSRKDVEVVAGSGCPNTDRKVVNSGKRLRAHVDIDEVNVGSEFLRYENNIQSFLLERDSQTNYLTFIASNINKHLSGLQLLHFEGKL